MDFNVEGVPNTVLRDFCRTFRNAGVGYYPNSTFVHLDARTGKVTWVDYSRVWRGPPLRHAGRLDRRRRGGARRETDAPETHHPGRPTPIQALRKLPMLKWK